MYEKAASKKNLLFLEKQNAGGRDSAEILRLCRLFRSQTEHHPRRRPAHLRRQAQQLEEGQHGHADRHPYETTPHGPERQVHHNNREGQPAAGHHERPRPRRGTAAETDVLIIFPRNVDSSCAFCRRCRALLRVSYPHPPSVPQPQLYCRVENVCVMYAATFRYVRSAAGTLA